MYFLNKIFNKRKDNESRHSNAPPFQWILIAKQSYAYGRHEDALVGEYKEVERFCAYYPLEPPKLLPLRICLGKNVNGGG